MFRIYPPQRPEYGSTVVTVDGKEFLNWGHTYCKWGTLTPVPMATFITSTRLLCVSPAYVPSDVPLEVTNNNQDYTFDNVMFSYQLRANVSYVYPVNGPNYGATKVTVYGRNFAETNLLKCRWGTNAYVAAEFVTTTHVRACLKKDYRSLD